MASNGRFRRELAINALLQTSTILAAAELAHISQRTIHRYLSDPKFVEALEEARRRHINSALDHLIVNSKNMAVVLTTVANDSLSPPSAKVSAARSALQLVLEAKQVAELEKKVMELERKTIDGKRVEWGSGNEIQRT